MTFRSGCREGRSAFAGSGRRREELERDPVGVAERDAGPVVRVDDAAVGDPQLVQPCGPVLQLVAVTARERDVVQTGLQLVELVAERPRDGCAGRTAGRRR